MIHIIVDDQHTKEIHKISLKTHIVDQTVEIIDIKITIQDTIQTNTDLTTDPLQILEIEIIQIIDLETPHTIGVEIILTIEKEAIQTIENLDINIIDQALFKQQIKILQLSKQIHGTKAQAITTDKETTLNHHIGITHLIKIHNKNIGVIHSNIKDKSIKYNQLKKLKQTPGVDNHESIELQLNNINCEFTDIDSDTENTISINLIDVENDYEHL